MRTRRTDETLRDVSDHLFYEVWMLSTLAHAMSTGVFGQGALNNAVLESFTMHARALLDFLYSESPQPDDVVADDFVTDTEQWRNARPMKSESLQAIHKRVGKEVAHLTYARLQVTPEAKAWNFAQIADEIVSTFNLFLDHVPEQRLGPSWNATLEQRKKQMGAA